MFYSDLYLCTHDNIKYQRYGERHIFATSEYYGTVAYTLYLVIWKKCFFGIFSNAAIIQVAQYYPTQIESVEVAVSHLMKLAEDARMMKVKERNKRKALLNIK